MLTESQGRLRELWPHIEQFQKLASDNGIDDVFQDNGGKILQTILHANMEIIPGRNGNDAKDADGREFELKSVNIDKTRSFSTHRRVSKTVVDKYRNVPWLFAVYKGIQLYEIWKVEPEQLEPYFKDWEDKCRRENKTLNNPKIPLKFVEQIGIRIHWREETKAG